MRKSLFRRLVALAILILLSIVAIVIGVTVLSSTAGGIILTFMGGVGLASGLVMGVMMLAHERVRKKNIRILRKNIDEIKLGIDEISVRQNRWDILKIEALRKLEEAYLGNFLSSPGRQFSSPNITQWVNPITETLSPNPSVIVWIISFFNPAEEDLLEILKKEKKRLGMEEARKFLILEETVVEVELACAHLKALETPALKKVENIMPWRDMLLRKGDEKIMLLEGEMRVPETKPSLGDSESYGENIGLSSENQTESSANRSLGL